MIWVIGYCTIAFLFFMAGIMCVSDEEMDNIMFTVLSWVWPLMLPDLARRLWGWLR